MGLEAVGTVLGWFSQAFSWSGLSGLSLALVALGFAILFVVAVGAAAFLLVRMVKNIVNMTVGQFIIFMVAAAFLMIIVGAVLPS